LYRACQVGHAMDEVGSRSESSLEKRGRLAYRGRIGVA
jgi:hypothetical protein